MVAPLVGTHESTDSGHLVDSSDAPSCCGLIEPVADQLFAGTFDLPAADHKSVCQPLCVVHMVSVKPHVVVQSVQ